MMATQRMPRLRWKRQRIGLGPWRARVGILPIVTAVILVGALPAMGAHVSPTVVATIPVGDGPHNVRVNPGTNRIYVSDNSSDALTVIDGATDTVLATIPVGDGPFGVGVNPATNRIYVANCNSGTVSVIDGATNSVVATIVVGGCPFGVDVNPATNRIYVANIGSDTVSVIDGASNFVVATVATGDGPSGVGVNPATNRIYVQHAFANFVSVIDGATNSVVATVDVGSESGEGVEVNPAINRIYVAIQQGDGSNTVSVIDGATNTVLANIPVGDEPHDLGVNPITNRIYVGNFLSDTVSVIDGATNTVVATVATGDGAHDAAVNPVTDRVYVANFFAGTVSVLADPPPIPSTATLYLHGSGGTANPPTLTLDEVAPTGTTPKYKDSPSVNFAGGNIWKKVGTWSAAPATESSTVLSIEELHTWLGLKNSDDQNTRFDLKAEVYRNDVQLISSGLTRCIDGITRNPSSAKNVIVPFDPIVPVSLNTGDVISLEVLTRIGTNADDSKCPGPHNNAVGIRMYFDAVSRAARFAVESTP